MDHEGEVLEVFASKHRDRRAALKFLKRTMKRYGRPRSIVTEARRIVPLMGGRTKVLAAATAALSKKEYAWAAQLVNYL